MWMSRAWLARFDELVWWAQYEDLEDDTWLSWIKFPCLLQLQALEESAEALRDRCQRFAKGCRKYTYTSESYF